MSRNGVCLQCGRKNKNCPGHASRSPWFVFLVCFGFILAVAIGATVVCRQTKVSLTEAQIKLQATLRRYHQLRINDRDSWWLPGDTVANDTLLESKKREILGILQRYRGVSQLTQEVAGQLLDEGQQHPVNLLFLSQNAFLQSGLPSPLCWNIGDDELKMAALSWPDPILAASIFHEFGHCLRAHRRNSSIKDMSTVGEEEVIMHELGLLITDAATNGRYLAAVDNIITRLCPTSWPGLVAAINEQDLFALDKALEIRESGPIVSGVVVSGHLFALGFRWCDQNQQEMSEKIKMYRWFVGTTSY